MTGGSKVSPLDVEEQQKANDVMSQRQPLQVSSSENSAFNNINVFNNKYFVVFESRQVAVC